MRTTVIPYATRPLLVKLAVALLHARSFSVLVSDGFSGQLVAQSNAYGGIKREAQFKVGQVGPGRFTVAVEVRNLGLELSRNRQNDLLEIELLRDFHKIVYEKSQPQGLALSA